MAKLLNRQTLHLVEELSGGKSADIAELPLEQIDLENNQFEYRLDPDIELLAESIRKDGQQIPVFLRGKTPPYQLICGFRRVRSLKELGEAKVKAIILPVITDAQAHRLSVLENEERKSLTDLDRANACKRLHDEGKTQEQIAEIMACSRPKVSRYLSLLSLPEPIYTALKKGRILTMHALLLGKAVGLVNTVQMDKWISLIEGKDLSFRGLEKKIKQLVEGPNQAPKPRPVIFRRTQRGFKLAGVTYKPDLPLEEKERVREALKQALTLLEEELEERGEAG